jgi:hypothetical protein
MGTNSAPSNYDTRKIGLDQTGHGGLRMLGQLVFEALGIPRCAESAAESPCLKSRGQRIGWCQVPHLMDMMPRAWDTAGYGMAQ